MEIKPEAVTAALYVLRKEFDLGDYAKVSNYIWEGQTSSEREAALKKLRDADEMAEAKVRIVISDAIRAAMACY